MPSKNDVNLVELLTAAQKHYPDQEVAEYWRRHLKTDHKVKLKKQVRGDTLAKFIAIEIVETYSSELDRKEKVETAIHAMGKAILDLESVIKGLRELRRENG